MKNNTTTNNTTTTSIDFFKADRALSTRVSEYFRCVLQKREIEVRFNEKIQALTTSIDNLDKLEGSLMADKIPEMKVTYETQIAALKKERDELINETAKFELTEGDKTLKKSVAKLVKNNKVTDEALEEAIAKWFDAYNLNVRGTKFVAEIIKSIGNKSDAKTLVKSNGLVADILNTANVLKMVYAKSFNRMVEAETIKPAQIPTLLRDKYAKKATKKNK